IVYRESYGPRRGRRNLNRLRLQSHIDSDPNPVTGRSQRVRHHFTVDVEEYFQVSALARYVPRQSWESIRSRLEVGIRPLLELLDEHNVRGTFFVLGWIAKYHP